MVHRVLHVDDTPHRIALGVAIGIFVTWTPTIGFQMVLTFALSWLLGANKLVGVPFVWISNPVTLVPIYLPNYYLGRWILGSKVSPPDFAKLARFGGGWIEQMSSWWSATWHAFYPLWVGSLLVAASLGVLAYIATYYAVIFYRREKQLIREMLERKHRQGKSDARDADTSPRTNSSSNEPCSS